MKFVKSISLFFLYPMLMFVAGVFTGLLFYRFFYPGNNGYSDHPIQKNIMNTVDFEKESEITAESVASSPEYVETIQKEATLTKDTIYSLIEVDIISGASHEFIYTMPEKYIGMNRDLFLGAMDAYEASPPLKEIERGFTDLEVISFSPEKVVVQISYLFIQPSAAFYLCVEENKVVVYLDDKETLYMTTDILLEHLPEEIQGQIINYMFISGEEELYHFLETYSS